MALYLKDMEAIMMFNVRGTEREEIPRHKEINEKLAKAILKRRGLL